MSRARGNAATIGDASARPWVVQLAALPAGFGDLAADAKAAGSRILDVLEQDWDSGAVRFDRPGEALFGAVNGDALLGILGVTCDPYMRDAAVMRVRRLYVLRAARCSGLGRQLVEAAAAQARSAGAARLRVRAPASAFAFYERCGFLRLVGEGAATHVLHLG